MPKDHTPSISRPRSTTSVDLGDIPQRRNSVSSTTTPTPPQSNITSHSRSLTDSALLDKRRQKIDLITSLAQSLRNIKKDEKLIQDNIKNLKKLKQNDLYLYLEALEYDPKNIKLVYDRLVNTLTVYIAKEKTSFFPNTSIIPILKKSLGKWQSEEKPDSSNYTDIIKTLENSIKEKPIINQVIGDQFGAFNVVNKITEIAKRVEDAIRRHQKANPKIVNGGKHIVHASATAAALAATTPAAAAASTVGTVGTSDSKLSTKPSTIKIRTANTENPRALSPISETGENGADSPDAKSPANSASLIPPPPTSIPTAPITVNDATSPLVLPRKRTITLANINTNTSSVVPSPTHR